MFSATIAVVKLLTCSHIFQSPPNPCCRLLAAYIQGICLEVFMKNNEPVKVTRSTVQELIHMLKSQVLTSCYGI